jgi:hypothetical protein
MSRMVGWLFLASVALTLIALVPDAITIGLMLFFVPGLLLLVAPNLLVYAAIPWIAARAASLGGFGWQKSALFGLAVFVAVVGLSFVVAQHYNRLVERSIAALQASDRAAALPSRIQTLGLALPDTRKIECGSLCQRLLYNRSVARVLVAASPNDDEPSGKPAMAYWIERRDACPLIDVPPATFWVTERRGTMTLQRPIDVAGNTKARIAAGECLMAEPASLDAADVIVVARTVKMSPQPYTAPFDLMFDTTRADRLSVFRHGDVRLEKILQRTHVQWRPLVAPLVFGAEFSSLHSHLAWARLTRHETPFEVEEFLSQDLKLDIRPGDGVGPEQERAMLMAALRSETSGAGLALVQPFLRRLSLSPQRAIEPADFEIVRLIVADDRIREDLGNLPTYFLGPEAEALARPLAQRLLAADPVRDSAYMKAVARIIALMPPGTMAPGAKELDALSRDWDRRARAAPALARLADSGPASAPQLVGIFSLAADPSVPAGFGSNPAGNEVIGAAQGLCRLGAAAASVRPYAAAIVRREVAGNTASWNLPRVVILLLARLGFSADVEDAFRSAGGIPRHIAQNMEQVQRQPMQDACRLDMAW